MNNSKTTKINTDGNDIRFDNHDWMLTPTGYRFVEKKSADQKAVIAWIISR